MGLPSSMGRATPSKVRIAPAEWGGLHGGGVGGIGPGVMWMERVMWLSPGDGSDEGDLVVGLDRRGVVGELVVEGESRGGE